MDVISLAWFKTAELVSKKKKKKEREKTVNTVNPEIVAYFNDQRL